MVKILENSEFTPESTVHLWSVPRKNQTKPSKDGLIQQLYTNKKLVGLDFRALSVQDLDKLVKSINSVAVSPFLEAPSRLKKPYLEHLSVLGLSSLPKVPLDTLKGLVEYLNDRN